MDSEQCKKVLDAIIDMWWQKVLHKMLSEDKSLEYALEEVKQEMEDV